MPKEGKRVYAGGQVDVEGDVSDPLQHGLAEASNEMTKVYRRHRSQVSCCIEP